MGILPRKEIQKTLSFHSKLQYDSIQALKARYLMMMGPYSCHYGFGGMGWIVMHFFWLLVLIGFGLLLVYFSRKKSAQMQEPDETALDIINKRYARGEITHEEYERIKQNISNKGE